MLAYYPSEQLTITGQATRFARPTAAGGVTETFFCPTCGSTMFVRVGQQPTMLGVPVGAFADPGQPAPMLSFWEQSKHDWVLIPEHTDRRPQG